MREILFRAKRLDNGEWVESATIKLFTEEILDEYSEWQEYDNNTICQFTGLRDTTESNARIWENDRAEMKRFACSIPIVGVVKYVGSGFVLADATDTWELDGYKSLTRLGSIHDGEV